MEKYVVILVTCGNKKEAENIANQLLNEKLIACANIVGPVSSHFHWKGKVESAEEFLALMKTRANLFDAVAERVRAMHSYEVPEVLALPVVDGSSEYLDWMRSNLKK
jgi:periplasmic divalent cation tolerance protein